MKELNGRELAGYIKANQAHKVRSLRARGVRPKLIIIRDSDNPVIMKYVHLKRVYGEDIGVEVEDWESDNLVKTIQKANNDDSVHGIIVQLPLKNPDDTDRVINEIAAEKDVDGLAKRAGTKPKFESATATAINWLLAGYGIELANKKIAIVGRGRLVGGPLEQMWRNSGYDVTSFEKEDSLEPLPEYEVLVSATGVPHLIKDEMVRNGAVVVDAGTASEGGMLVGDVDDAVRQRNDLKAMTPKVGGVGPLTVTALFDHVLMAAEESLRSQTR